MGLDSLGSYLLHGGFSHTTAFFFHQLGLNLAAFFHSTKVSQLLEFFCNFGPLLLAGCFPFFILLSGVKPLVRATFTPF
jgi:hypothetical protein